MKNWKKILAAATAGVICAVGAPWTGVSEFHPAAEITASAAEYGDLTYDFLDDGTIEITGCDTSVTSVDIPAEIDGVAVTSIGGWAFSHCYSLIEINVSENNSFFSSEDGALLNKDKTTLICCPGGKTTYTIPDSVISIGDYAFYLCKSLTSITIPDSVTSIEDFAFADCTSLTSITIPDSVTSIGDWAFADCTSLTSITIPDSVTSIGAGAFSECNSLTEINVSENNSFFSSEDGALLNKDKTTLICCPGGKTTYTIPDSVTSIGSSAFLYCRSLTSITIPDGVTSIGAGAFSECNSLTSITIPDGVTSIGYGAFLNCTSLTSITIPDSVTSIGKQTFYGCESLISVTIPDSVTSIESEAFNVCMSLTSITILNPTCSIYDSYWTISSATIYGYSGSTAESYAKTYERTFISLDKTPVVTTTTTKSPTTTTTTTTAAVKAQETGDLDGDGKITINDAYQTLMAYSKASAGLDSGLTDAQIAAADVDGDGKVTINDAYKILLYYATKSAGGSPSWD